MSQVLDKGTRNFIENEALKLQKDLKIISEPNVYDFSSILHFFRKKKWRFQFNVKLKKTSNTMNGTIIEDSMEQIIKYNVIDSENAKTLQFDIKNPNNLDSRCEYMMFLRAIFYEYWGEIKEKTEYKGIEFSDNLDYSLFSRAMIVPYKEFRRISLDTIKLPKSLKISDIADKFYVLYVVIEDRINDCGWIAN